MGEVQYRDIIRRPIITEKSTIQKEKMNKVAFEVSPYANKIEIKRAIETIFNVHVMKVNVLNIPGKRRRVGRNEGITSGWKKAYVTLKKGEFIDFFEGT